MKIILLIGCVLISWQTSGQALSSEIPGAPIIQLDLENGLVKDEVPVPYGTRLIFKGTVLKQVENTPFNKLFVFYRDKTCPDPAIKTLDAGFEKMTEWHRADSTIAGRSNVASFVSKLDPKDFFLANRNYCLVIRRDEDKTHADTYQQQVSFRTASKFGDFIKLDFGVGYSSPIKAVIGTASIHIYAKPTNEFVNLAERFPFTQQLLMRTSLFIGIAPITLTSSTKQAITPFSAVGNLVFGLGYRAPTFYPKHKYKTDKNSSALSPQGVYRKDFNQALRINLGFVVFKQANPSPLIDNPLTLIEPYVSITYDTSLKGVLAPIALLLGIK